MDGPITAVHASEAQSQNSIKATAYATIHWSSVVKKSLGALITVVHSIKEFLIYRGYTFVEAIQGFTAREIIH